MLKPKPNEKKLTVDAAESNAGDDFHILWAVRKSLELLNFSDEGLKAVTIEGLDDIENKKLDSTGDLLLGADITEYYGGGDFLSAKRVVISQLKYSTRRANLEWTASRITKDNKGQAAGSIIGRLSNLFAGLIKEFGETEITGKLVMKLVSNRPVSNLLLSTIQDIQNYIEKNRQKLSVTKLKQILNVKQLNEFTAIQTATKLKGKTLFLFLEILDLSDCGVGSRLYQKQQIISAIGKLGSSHLLNEYSQLRELIWGKMMPEQKRLNKIAKEDILYKFGISDIDDIFPVRSNFGVLKNIVPREQLPDISQQIIEGFNNIICLHAGAGMGKSTIVKQLVQTFPENSICILFDCYGNGAYDDPADKRHSHQRALLQICNELALKIGTPLLLQINGTNDYYIREFKKRISDVATILNEVNPSAIIAIIIDAADNSVSASLKYQEKCFIHNINQMELPKNCKLVFTCRTERLLSLKLPEEYQDICLNNFTLNETSQFLRPYFDNISENSIKEFWNYTKAIPRVMSYAMEIPGESIEEKMKFLKPNGKSLEDIFKIRIKEATKRCGDANLVNSFLRYLSALPSPVPTTFLKDLVKITDEFLNDINTDLWNGLVIEFDNLSFRDEDFETYIRTKYSTRGVDYNAIASYLLNKADQDEYASIHLGLLLSKSNKQSELVPIVLERKYLVYPKDPVKNREVFIERTKLAMQFCTPTSTEFLKVQMIAADAAKTNQALEEILTERADLASAYGNIRTNQKIYFQSGNPEWFGSAHYRSAAILSRKKETQDIAEKHLIQAKKWREYRATLPEEKRREFHIDEYDLANGAEAVLRITEDLLECIDWIVSWRPKNLLYVVADILLSSIMSDIEFIKKIDLSPIAFLRVDIQLLIAKHFIQVNEKLPFKIDTIIAALPVLRKLKAKFSIELSLCIMYFAEYLFSIGYEKQLIIEWLDLCIIEPPKSPPRFYSNIDKGNNLAMDIFLRRKILISVLNEIKLKISDLYPQNLLDALSDEKLKSNKKYEDEKKEFDQIYTHLIYIYRNRAKGILGIATKEELEKVIIDALSLLDRDYEFAYRQSYRMQDTHLFMALKILDVVFHNNEHLIDIIKDGYSLKNKNNIRLYISIALKLSRKAVFYTHVLKQLDLIDKLIPESSLAASQQIEYYADMAKIASRISSADGKYYFDKMVMASNEIDLEAHEQIKCINYMLEDTEFLNNSELAFSFARYVEYCSDILRGWDHFPWAEGISGVAKLDIASTFAIICQWDHRNVREVRDHFIDVLLVSLKANYLPPEIAGGLLPINEIYWEELLEVAKLIISKFDLKEAYLHKNLFVKSFIRDLKLRCASDRIFFLLIGFLELIENGKFLDIDILAEFKEYCGKIEALIDYKKNKEESPSYNRVKDASESRYSGLIENVNEFNATTLEFLLHQAKSLNENKFVDEVLLFKMIQDKIPDTECINYLNEFIKLDIGLINSYYYEDILSNTLEKWNSFSQVKLWKAEVFKGVLQKRFLTYYEHEYMHTGGIKKLAKVFEISDNILAPIVRDILPEYLGELSDKALYQLFYLTVRDLKKEKKEDLIGWTLAQWNSKINDPLYDKIFTEQYNESSCEATIASFLKYHLGHSDKRIRWRAIHSLQRLASLENKKIFDILIRIQNNKSCQFFQNADYPFYWMSAKLYLWVAMEGISIELPGFISEYANECCTELFNSSLPHAQIDYFIRKTCANIFKQNKSLFDGITYEKIEKIFDSTIKPHRKKRNNIERKYRNDNLNTRFQFDYLDTLPYWYASLGMIFGLSSYEIAQIADKFIAGQWGYHGYVNEIDHLKNVSYELSSNRHGSSPVIENLQTYLEYHAMFCTASELLKTKPIASNENFKEWIEDWGKTWDNFWLSDLRDPIPLEKKYWDKTRNEDEWEWNFNLEDFKRGIGIKDPSHSGYLLVRGGSSIYYGGDCESQYIASALVNPKTSFSLLRTLQEANKYDYSIPYEENPYGEDYYNEDFKMEGWIKYIETHKEGLDDVDELFNKIERGRIAPGTLFSRFASVTLSNDFRYSFDMNGEKCSILETWSNIPEDIDRHYDLFASSGSRLFIKIDTLLLFLKRKKKNLLLLCEFSRRPKKKEYNESRSYYKQLFLIYPDGNIKTLSRDYKLSQ